MGLKVQLLEQRAKAPTVAHPGEDIGYDLYALEGFTIVPGTVKKVRTGVSVEATDAEGKPLGLLIKDRSSMAANRVFTHGGVIDPGYRGEIIVLMSYNDGPGTLIGFQPGTKIAQMVPVPILTGEVEVVDKLTTTSRGEGGFGSTGQ